MDLHKPISAPSSFKDNALVKEADYQSLYRKSIDEPERFWGEQAERISWIKKWERVKQVSFTSPVKISWFEGARLNACYNCVDRHLEKSADRIAFIWEQDDPAKSPLRITYWLLHEKVCQMANVLKSGGVKKGDRVTIYMPMIPETVYAMLACARIGAVHSVVFAGFSSDSLVDRITDCDSRFIITADQGLRGGKKIPLKDSVDKALKSCTDVEKTFVYKHTGAEVTWNDSIDVDLNAAMEQASGDCEIEPMDAEDPLFILYTSGSTNKPKGVLHTTGGYMVYASLTHQWVFDYKPSDVYWCAADVGWVTGHSYIVYGPLANCATSVLFEGVPSSPTWSRYWEIIDRHQVSILYTSPTAIRALMQHGEGPVKKCSRKSLRLLGSVGEPINPEAWRWYHDVIGEQRAPIVDTWWQTETGGIMITPLPGAMDMKPGSASLPFFGVRPVIVDHEGQQIDGTGEGMLCIEDSWPGQMRTVYKDHRRFEETYFSQFKGKYFTGDGCHRDADGFFWITGRVDDVLNVSGHRLGSAEIESALVAHNAVSEAAVVGYPHDLKGQGIYAYVTLMDGASPSEELKKELVQAVRGDIGPIATPDLIQWAPSLPKTRSGKIMRRILRKIAENAADQLGDTSTLAEPEVVDQLVRDRLNR